MTLVVPNTPDYQTFLADWPNTLAQEGPYPNDWTNPKNFSNTPGDPGGATMDGIIQTEYNLFRVAQGEPVQSVRLITQTEGAYIYYSRYWLPHCPSVPSGLKLSLFDSNVNEGPGEGTRILQFAVGANVDGVWGPETNKAVAAITNVVAVINAFTARREAVYQETSGFGRFGADWIRRAVEIGRQSLALATPQQPKLALEPKGDAFRHVPRASFYMPGSVV